MEFLTILIALGLLQLWGSGRPVQHDGWFFRLATNVQPLTRDSRWQLLILLALPVLAVAVVDDWLDGVLFGLLSLALYVVVLLYSFGRGDFSELLQQYLMHWNNGNFESAHKRAALIGDFSLQGGADDYESLHEQLRRAVVYDGFQRWFAVIFWFLLFGPVGALLYRLAYLAGRNEAVSEEQRQLALRFIHYLDWLPARLLSFSFAIVGHFDRCFNRWWLLISDNQPVADLLEDCALAAIEESRDRQLQPTDREHYIEFGRRQLEALQVLLSRSVVCWVVVIALLQFVLD